jgi:hypothetical protein
LLIAAAALAALATLLGTTILLSGATTLAAKLIVARTTALERLLRALLEIALLGAALLGTTTLSLRTALLRATLLGTALLVASTAGLLSRTLLRLCRLGAGLRAVVATCGAAKVAKTTEIDGADFVANLRTIRIQRRSYRSGRRCSGCAGGRRRRG